MPSVAILYGFTEGAWHGNRFNAALRQHGYSIEPDPLKADVVVAHSGGAFYIPELHDKQHLMIINPPYWPQKAWPAAPPA